MDFSRAWIVVISLGALVMASACTKKSATGTSAETSPKGTARSYVERGRSIYKLNCISCHNTDPSVDGVLGPSLKGSSLELLKARVLKAKYPEGYKPKRDTHTMPALPQLEAELPALAAYLNSN